MSRLTLPEGAEAGFRFCSRDAFDNRFTAHIYGARRDGWLIAVRHLGDEKISEVGPIPLIRPQWREFLGLIKQSGFWELPADWPWDFNIAVDDGCQTTLAGRQGERSHEVHRWPTEGPGLFRVGQYLRRISGLFPEPTPRPAIDPPL